MGALAKEKHSLVCGMSTGIGASSQRLIQFHVLSKSMSGQQLACKLITCLSVKFGLLSHKIVAAMHDRAAVNSAVYYTP